MPETSRLRPKLMLLIAVAQGIFLLLLRDAHDSGTWPAESPLWSFPLWTLSLAVPVLLLLSLEAGRELATIKWVTAFAAVIGLAAIYVGYQAQPFGEFRLSTLSFVFGASITLACFKALMYIQQRAAGTAMSYAELFTYSWRNFLTLALALIFVLAFWLILILWAQLFRVIEINFFDELFRMDWFLYPVLGFAHGLGIIIFRNLTNVIDSITKLLQGLIKLLLPLVVFVAAIFILSLPVVGFDGLWATGRGTSLLLWLLAIILFFTNAVYQDGRETHPYPKLIHRMIYAGICIGPLISALSFYGLWLRVDQYGWTVSRCWAFVAWLVLTLFAIGYTQGIVRKRDTWTTELARVNTAMGLVVLVLMLVANSPALDFRKISLASQVGRVESGETEWKDFDFWYTRNSLARPGYLKMEALKQTFAETDPELVTLIDNPRNLVFARPLRPVSDLWREMKYRPEPFEVPGELRSRIERQNINRYSTESVLIRDNFDNDGEFEYLLVFLNEDAISGSLFFYQENGEWLSGSVSQSWTGKALQNGAESIRTGEMSLIPPRFKNLYIGDQVLRPVESGQ